MTSQPDIVPPILGAAAGLCGAPRRMTNPSMLQRSARLPRAFPVRLLAPPARSQRHPSVSRSQASSSPVAKLPEERVRAFVYLTQPGDAYRAGRTLRSLRAAGIAAEQIGGADRATARGHSPRRRSRALPARRHVAGPARASGAPAPQRHRQRAVRSRRASGSTRERARHGAGRPGLDGAICQTGRQTLPGLTGTSHELPSPSRPVVVHLLVFLDSIACGTRWRQAGASSTWEEILAHALEQLARRSLCAAGRV